MDNAILIGISFGLFMAISVGPTIFAILKYSISYGHRAGICYVLGVSLSDALYVFLANFASSFLAKASDYEKVIGTVGAIIFIVMGIFGMFRKIKIQRNSTTIVPIGFFGLLQIGLSGFLMNSFNPGVILTWITMVAAVASQTISYRMVVFGTCLGLILAIDFLKIFMANKVRRLLTPRNIVYLTRISALCLLGVGVFLFVKFFFEVKVGNF